MQIPECNRGGCRAFQRPFEIIFDRRLCANPRSQQRKELLATGSLDRLRKSSFSHALMFPGRTTNVASGKFSFNAGRIGPFGPSSKLVVRMVGSLKYVARRASAKTLFLNSAGVKSCTRLRRPDWCSVSGTAALSRRRYINGNIPDRM
jgi:hypothetical protein